MYRLLIIEDDAGIADAIRAHAETWGMQVYCISDFRNVISEFAEFKPHIVLFDISLPFFDGYYRCSEIRKVSKVPIIFISSASDSMNMIMPMNMGADDLSQSPSIKVCSWQSSRRYSGGRTISPTAAPAIIPQPRRQTVPYGI